MCIAGGDAAVLLWTRCASHASKIDPGIFHCLLNSIIVWMFAFWKSENAKDNLLSFFSFTSCKIHTLRFSNFSCYWKLAMWGCNISFYLIILWYLYGEWGGIEVFSWRLEVFMLQKKVSAFLLEVSLCEEFFSYIFCISSHQNMDEPN